MTEVIIAIAIEVSKYLVGLATHHGKYLFCVGKLTEQLQKEMVELMSREIEVSLHVEEAKKKTRRIEPAVEDWLREVQSLLKEVDNYLEKLHRANGRFCHFCPPWKSYGLCKQLAKKIKIMSELNNEGKFETFSRVASLPTNITSSTNIMLFESTKLAFSQILEALKDDNCHIICLYGMGGCGKTTLAREVGRIVNQELNLFDKVAFIVLSQAPNVRKVQGEIADVLGLTPLHEESEAGRAKRLSEGFKKYNGRFLVILDDVWGRLNLDEFGIPSDENLKGCKILLTTRGRDICSLMNGQKNVPLDLLSPPEAWAFFQKQACITEDSSLSSVAQEVVAECKELPIAIQAVATTLKGKSLDSWKDALYKLRHSKPIDVPPGVMDAYNCIQLSYDALTSKEAKRLFLMCCIFPEDHKIEREDLFIYGVGLGLFGEDGSFDDLRSRVKATLDHLVDHSLLMNFEIQDDCFKIHDVVRDFAIWKAPQEDWFVIADHKEGIKSLALDGTVKNCSAISTWGIKVDRFPQQLDCPKLEILLLNSTNYWDLSQASFEGTRLKVMALVNRIYSCNWVHPLSLPLSTDWLTNLQALRLVGYDLGGISFVVFLKGLVILDLYGSKFKSLPKGIEELKKLKMLDLRGCSIVENFDEVIRRCSQLEELYVCGNGAFLGKNVDSQASLLEGTSFQKLHRYELQMWKIQEDVYCQRKGYRSCLSFGELYISNISICVKNLIKKAERIHLQNLHGGCKSIFPKFVGVVGDMTSLIELALSHCHEIEFFICLIPTQVSRFHVNGVFSMLVKLRLYNMDNLKHVCYGSLPPNFFQKLEQVVIQRCPDLISIFPEKCNLQNLRELYISDCPMLTSLLPISVAQSLSQLEELTIQICSNLRHIIVNEEHNTSGGRPEIFQASESSNSMFRQLKSLDIIYCDNLEYVLPTYCAQDLLQLQRIEIRNVSQMKYVFGEHVVEDLSTNQNEIQIVLPQLQEMYLGHLTSLVNICPENCCLSLPSLTKITWKNFPKLADMIEFFIAKVPHFHVDKACNLWNLRDLLIGEYPMLTSLFPMSVAQSLSQLEALTIESCSNLRHIIINEEHNAIDGTREISQASESSNSMFPKLKWLTVKGCDNLEYVLSIYCAQGLSQLQSINIVNASQMKYVFGKHVTGDLSTNQNEIQILLPQLQEMVLEDLTSLVRICPKNCCPSFPSLEEITWKNRPELANMGLLGARDECEMSNEVLGTKNCGVINLFHHQGDNDLQEPPALKLEIVDLEYFPHQSIIERVFNSSQVLSLSYLQSIRLSHCQKLKCVFPAFVHTCFPHLTNLCIKECEDLGEIFAENGELQKPHRVQERFPKLGGITLEGCGRLNRVFPTIIGSNFPNLSTLCIKNCENLEEIFAENGELQKPHRVQERFPKLEGIALSECGKLKCVFPTIIDSNFPNLTRLCIQNCEDLEEIFAENGELQKPHRVQECFQELQVLHVCKCPKLKFVFPIRMARYFPQSNSPSISGDSELKEIFRSTNENISNIEKEISAPNLRSIELEKLPSLVDIYQGFDFLPNELVKVHIQDCPKFSVIPKAVRGWRTKGARVFVVMDGNPLRSNEDPTLPLTYVLSEEFGSCGVIDIFQIEGSVNVGEDEQHQLTGSKAVRLGPEHELWRGPIPITMVSFQFLQRLTVRRCGKLKYLLPMDAIYDSLPELLSLVISDCDELEQVVVEEENADRQQNGSTPKAATKCFPKLEEIEVKGCKELIRFFPATITTTDKIVLPNLTWLRLEDLPSLVGLKDQVHIPRCSLPQAFGCPNSGFTNSATLHQLVRDHCFC